jgi:hypothetical protein
VVEEEEEEVVVVVAVVVVVVGFSFLEGMVEDVVLDFPFL